MIGKTIDSDDLAAVCRYAYKETVASMGVDNPTDEAVIEEYIRLLESEERHQVRSLFIDNVLCSVEDASKRRKIENRLYNHIYPNRESSGITSLAALVILFPLTDPRAGFRLCGSPPRMDTLWVQESRYSVKRQRLNFAVWRAFWKTVDLVTYGKAPERHDLVRPLAEAMVNLCHYDSAGTLLAIRESLMNKLSIQTLPSIPSN